jgi:hypothetical protein
LKKRQELPNVYVSTEPGAVHDRLPLRVVLGEVLVNKPGERERRSGAVCPPHPLQRPLERLLAS